MKYVYLALNWVFGVLFLLAGLLSLVESPLGGLCLIIISFLLLPPLRKFVYSKTNKELPVKARAVTIFALFVAFGVFVGQAHDKKEQELAAQQAQEQAEKAPKRAQEDNDYYNQNKDEIVDKANEDLSQKDEQALISQTPKYFVARDEPLQKINTPAHAAIVEKHKIEKTKSLLA